MGFVLSVHGFCTPSTWPLYSEYKGHVLLPDRLDITENPYRCNAP